MHRVDSAWCSNESQWFCRKSTCTHTNTIMSFQIDVGGDRSIFDDSDYELSIGICELVA